MERTNKNKGNSNFMMIKNQNKNDVTNSCNDVKNLWDLSNGTSSADADLLGLFSWPPRSYTCTFCKREFRSAQALGGHMNVHRRDRARLRQSPPRDIIQGPPYINSLLNLNLDPNINPSVSSNYNPSLSSSSSSSPKPPVFSLPSLIIPPSVSTISTTPPATHVTEMRKWGKADDFVKLSHSRAPLSTPQDLMKRSKATRRFFELEKLGSIMHENGSSALKKSDNIVRLELEIGLLSEVKEDVDLELRLGYI